MIFIVLIFFCSINRNFMLFSFFCSFWILRSIFIIFYIIFIIFYVILPFFKIILILTLFWFINIMRIFHNNIFSCFLLNSNIITMNSSWNSNIIIKIKWMRRRLSFFIYCSFSSSRMLMNKIISYNRFSRIIIFMKNIYF